MDPTVVEVRVSSSSDDAEESVGVVDLSSSDLELVHDTSPPADQTIGLRFTGLQIPQGAQIVSAYVQFQVDEVKNSEPSALVISGEAADNAQTFTTATADISSRPTTTATVNWAPPTWTTVGEAGPDQQTPGIAAVIQEIVDRPGWSAGGALALVITGTGVRTAESYNGNAGAAPLLHIEYVLADPSNQSPQATDDTATIAEDTEATVAVLTNDSDPDGDPLSVTGVGNPANGTASINPDGTITYTPDANFNGADSFTYTVADGRGGSATATLDVTVTPVNDDPQATDDTVNGAGQSPIVIPVLANDQDVDGDPLTVTGVTQGAEGGVAINPDGTVTYTPGAGFAGSDSFTYTVGDGNGGSDTATVSIGSIPPPVLDLPGIQTFSGSSGDVINLPHDPSLAIAEATIAFSFVADAVGSRQGLFTKDASGFSGGGNHLAIYIQGGTLRTRFQDGSSSTVLTQGGLVAGQEYEVAATFGLDGVHLYVDGVLVGSNSGFAMSWTSNQEFLQIGGLGWGSQTGQGSFTNPFSGQIADVQIYDAVLDADQIAALAGGTGPVNDDPQPMDDTATTDEDTAAIIDVLTNDGDPDGDPLSVTGVGNPANGTASINPDGTVTYTPDADFNGADSFTYTVADGNGGSATATVDVTVTPVNDDPQTTDDTAATQEDTAAIVDVLTNDSDPDGDPLTVTGVGNPANGTASINPDGTITYTPGAGFIGGDSFTYTIGDGNGGSATATVDVTVTPVNDDPQPTDDTATTDEDTAAIIDVLSNDGDPDGDPLTVTGVGNPANGTASINPDGTVTYTPDADFNGADSFTYTVADGNGGSAIATVDVTVTPVNDDPQTTDDTANASGQVPIVIPVLANDGDPDGDPLTVTAVTQGAQGSVTINPDDTVTYAPGAGFNGSDSFTYTVEDGNGGSANATVSVQAINSAPVLTTGVATFLQQVVDTTMPLTHMVVAADYDGDGDIDIASTSEGSNTVAWYENDGNLNFTKRVIDGNLNSAYPLSTSDIDQDGDADILAAGYRANQYVLYENDGLGNFTKNVLITEVGPHSIQTVDIDGDGDNDLVTASQDANTISWLENLGGLTFVQRTIDTAAPAAKTAMPADIDGDGDPDIVTTEFNSGTVAWHENDGSGSFVKHIVSTSTSGAYFAVAGDFDNDGAQDIVSASQLDNTIAWYRNDGAENFTKIVIDSGAIAARSVFAADVDGDGDLDVLSASVDNSTVAFYENAGDGSFTKRIVSDTVDGAYGVGAFDVNRDGQLDVMSAGRNDGTISLHLQSKAHTVDVLEGGSVQIGQSVLKAVDVDDSPAELTFTVLTEPTAGELRLDGTALQAGDTFTQQDVDQDRVIYVHLVPGETADGFTFSLVDGGESNVNSANGSFAINVVLPQPEAVDDQATTAEDAAAIIDVLTNDSNPNGNPLTVTGVGTPANGAASINPDGTITYTPDANFNGADSFTYTVGDGSGGSATATVDVTVTPVPDAPVAVDDTVNGVAQSPVVIPVLANDGDPDGDPLTVTAVTQGAQGSVTINPDDTVTYAPGAGFSGSDSFTYTVEDGNGGSDTATVSVESSADPVFDLPGIQTFNGSSGDVINLPHDPNWAVAEATIAFSFVADAVGSRQGLFTKDASGFSGGGNHLAIYIQSGTLRTRFQDGSSSTVLTQGGLVAGQEYEVAATFGANGVQLFVDGVLVGSNNGFAMSWTTNQEFLQIGGLGWGSQTGQGSFTNPFSGQIADVQIYDAVLDADQIAALAGTSTLGNDDPQVVGDTATIDEDTAAIIDVLSNDGDPDGDPLSVTAVGTPANGTASINPDGTITYTPDANFNGADSFTYTVEDGNGGSGTATVDVTVSPVPDAPVAIDDTAMTQRDTAVIIAVLANDGDPDGDPLTVTTVTQGAQGSVAINPDGTVTYTPVAGFIGPDSFTYAVGDDNGGSAIGTVDVTVTPFNDDPQLVGDTATTDEDTAAIIDVLTNDSDPDGDPLTVTGVGTPANGAAAINPDGTITYTPDPDFNGADSFTYTVEDGNGGSGTATVDVTVSPVPDAPVAVDDTAATQEDIAAIVDVLTNDSDPDGDPLTVTGVGNPANGTASINPDGTITYTPGAGFIGGDSFTYTVGDGNGGSATATVDVTVSPPPSADPTILEVRVATGSDDAEESFGAVDLSSSDLELVHDTSPPANQTVGMRFTGLQIPQGAQIAAAYLQFQVDELKTSDPSAMVIAGESVDNAQTFASANANISSRPTTTATVNWTPPVWTTVGEAGADQQTPDLAPIIQEIVSRPGWSAGGALALVITGTGVRTAESYNGSASAAPLLHIEFFPVDPNNQSPQANPNSATTDEDTAATIAVLANDSDPDGDPLTVTGVGPAANGAATINPDGTVTYTPDPNFNGADGFIYTVGDGRGGSATATVDVTVNPVNDDPNATDDTAVTQQDTAVDIAVLANDGDPDGDPLSVTAVGTPGSGTAAINPNGTITYTPSNGFVGSDSFTYTVGDGSGSTDIAVVDVFVGIDPPPAPSVTFAAFGDYGDQSVPEQLVADFVNSLNPDFIITTGDNSYFSAPIDDNVGQYYSDYIGNYTGAYGAGSLTNRFFPTLGNHDWDDGGGVNAYLNYFTLPGNGIETSNTSGTERYYDFKMGSVHFFALDSDSNEPDGNSPASVQGQWLQSALAASDATWKVVYFHHPPYSSGSLHGSNTSMQWPFEVWGADAVFGGHDHIYERVIRDDNGDNVDMPYFVTGLGGRLKHDIGSTIVAGSEVQYSADYGTMLVEASETEITYQFISITNGGTVIDSYTDGGDGNDTLIGEEVDEVLYGGVGNDTLIGGLGNDTLRGGAGNDVFVWGDGDGSDTIDDFIAGTGTDDILDLRAASAVNNLADVQARAVQVGADTVIDVGNGDTMTLRAVNASDLNEEDFLFV